MRISRKAIFAAILCIVLVFSVACGGGSTQQAPAANDSAGGSTQNNAATSESAVSGETINIVYQSWNPRADQMELVAQDFANKYPGIEVEYIQVPYTDHIQKLKIDLSSGQGPDVFALQTGAPLKEFRDFEVDLAPLAAQTWGADWEKIFVPFTTELIRDGSSYYALPLGVGYAGMIWADLSYFTKYNFELPKNLTELKSVTQALRGHGELYPLAIGAKDDWINLDMWMNIMNDINSAKLYSAIDGNTPFTDPEVVESFAIWQSLFTERVFQDGALGVNMYVDTTDLFERERIVPMITNGAWVINSYPNTDPEIFAAFNDGQNPKTVFTMDWNNDGKPAPVQANVEIAVCMNKDSNYPDQAWEFISYLMFGGQDILVNEYLMYFPSRVDMDYTGELSEEGKENLEILMDWGANNVGGYRENPYPELKQSIADNLKALALDEVTPEQAAAAVEAVSQSSQR
ncbi:MAG: ABC transporter substrate-binding protein [Oscillospiraceae bacterium]|nr:ABC transporter substrate-binding protein [Oscillospiraceae bacterium]